MHKLIFELIYYCSITPTCFDHLIEAIIRELKILESYKNARSKNKKKIQNNWFVPTMEIVYCEVRILRKCYSSRGYPWSSSVLQKVPKFARFTACYLYSPKYADIKTQPKFSTHSDTPNRLLQHKILSAPALYLPNFSEICFVSNSPFSEGQAGNAWKHLRSYIFSVPVTIRRFSLPLPPSLAQFRLRVSECGPPVLPPSDSFSRQQ